MQIGEKIKNYRKTAGLTQEPVSYTHLTEQLLFRYRDDGISNYR